MASGSVLVSIISSYCCENMCLRDGFEEPIVLGADQAMLCQSLYQLFKLLAKPDKTSGSLAPTIIEVHLMHISTSCI